MGGILWLASYPKSGNTWLRAFLANLFKNLTEPVDINELRTFAPNEASRAYFERAAEGPIERLSDVEIYRLRPKVHRLIAGQANRTIFLKTHCALTRIADQSTITPEATAGAIYVVRNPLDVAASFAAFFGAEPDTVVAALRSPSHELPSTVDQVHQYIGPWSAHVAGWTEAPGLRRLVLRYEDMARRPFPTFAEVGAFLGLPKDKTRLRKAISFSSFDVLSRQERAHGFAERPDRAERFFRKGTIGGYRDTLSPRQIDALIEDHAEVMRRFGYLGPDGRLRY